MNINPLHASHERAGAEFQPCFDVQIVSTFGEPQAEYSAIRKAAAIMDLPQRGILELTGKDRHAFLNNLLTNQTWNKDLKKPMDPYTGVYAFYLNTKGRIVADVTVLDLADRTLLEMDQRLVEPLRVAFEKYLFTEQVKLTNRLGQLHELLLTGPKALDALNDALAEPLTELTYLQSITTRLLDVEVAVFRDDPAGVPGYYIVCPEESASLVWHHFTAEPDVPDGPDQPEQFARFRGLARPVGWAAFNATRIEAGRPIFGIDFDDSILPAETGQFARAVSVTKGCYLGQEIVARMHARNQVAKQLVGIRMDSDALPLAGTKIYDDAGNEVGGITSSTISPVLSRSAIALGYVKRPLFALGTRLKVPAEGSMRDATVVELPFLRP